MTPADRPGAVIAAGGTGGHLFPAQALAQELARRGWRVWLMTDERANQYGVTFPSEEIVEIPAATISPRHPIAAVAGVFKIGLGLVRAWRELGRLKPAAVIGFGGYPTLPPLLAAIWRGIPTCVHEANAVIGRANRIVASRVDLIASTFENPRLLPPSALSRLRVTGNPTRDAVIEKAGAPYDTPEPEGPFRLLVVGGSQGARIFSDIVPPAIASLPPGLRGRLRIVQQCREEDLARVEAVYREAGVDAELAPFFRDLPDRVAACHLVVCRSGASTVCELGVIGRPALMVPLPHSLEGDQLYNARALEEAGGGWAVEQAGFTPEYLAGLLSDMMSAPERLADAAKGAASFGRPQAVAALADLVESLAAGHGSGTGKQK